MKLGIDNLLYGKKSLLSGKRLGVLAHKASVNIDGHHTVDRIAAGGFKITALFGPEHGVQTEAQDMEGVDHAIDKKLGVPVYSLYGHNLDSLKPTAEMLDKIDTLVIDLQDVGSRYYTYVWTACLAAEACAECGKEVIVCDRPNPINGQKIEGGIIDEGFESFVGLHSLPVRHGMTIGEIVDMVNRHSPQRAKLEVVQMDGWKRKMSWEDTKLPWTNPSPNMRSYNAALLYPGMCLIETTNISEGRGAETPFEMVGAPYFKTDKFVDAFNDLKLDGIIAAPSAFIPTRQKWEGRLCNGVRWIVSDAEIFNSYLTGLAFTWLSYKLYKDKGKGFMWRDAPYEFVTNRPAIDLLTGSSWFRENIENVTLEDLKKIATTPKEMLDERKNHLFYK